MKEDLLKIINHYGVNAQQRKLAEEVFELQEAIHDCEYEKTLKDLNLLDTKYAESNSDVAKKRHIVEEIADVMVLLFQFSEYYDLDIYDISKIMDNKIKRQLERIKNEVKK